MMNKTKVVFLIVGMQIGLFIMIGFTIQEYRNIPKDGMACLENPLQYTEQIAYKREHELYTCGCQLKSSVSSVGLSILPRFNGTGLQP